MTSNYVPNEEPYLNPQQSLAAPFTTEEAELTQKLCQHIEGLIKNQGGQISFHDFMQAALYTPELGYYMNARPKLGQAGDFTTAPEISPLFSTCIAKQAQEVLAHCEHPDILEFGAGSGALAAQVLLTLESMSSLPEHYYILELSGALQAEQQTSLQQHCPHLLERVSWLSTLPEQMQGFIIANEVLDAMPVHVCEMHTGQEYYVRYENDTWQWALAPPSTDVTSAINTLTSRYPALREDTYQTEINLYLQPWLQSINTCLTKGSVLLIDYGYPQKEYYHPERHQGTLICHYRQRAHSDPFFAIGLQDLTANVDFTAVAEAADSAGFSINGFCTQAYFLMSAGILDDLDLNAKPAVMQLISPNSMGDRFKVMQLNKNFDLTLSGFKLSDTRYRL